MQLNKATIAVLLVTIIGVNINAQQPGLDDISAYYGFGEMR